MGGWGVVKSIIAFKVALKPKRICVQDFVCQVVDYTCEGKTFPAILHVRPVKTQISLRGSAG